MESKTQEREWNLYSVDNLPGIIMGQLIGSEIHGASISPKLFKTNNINYNHYKCINLICYNEYWFWCKIFIHHDKYDEVVHQEVDYHLQAESIRQKLGDNSKFETAHMAVTTKMADWLRAVEGMSNIRGQWATILASKIDGIILSKFIQHDFVSFTDVCLILNTVTEFVKQINISNIIHLGINPQDIMIVRHENNFIIKILDWTKYFGTSALVSKTDSNEWLPRNMLVTKEPKTFTTGCNNWMLGITIWYCVAHWLNQHNQIDIHLAPFASVINNVESVYTDRAKMPPSIYDICDLLFTKESVDLTEIISVLNKTCQMYEVSLMRELQYLPTKKQLKWTRYILANLNTQDTEPDEPASREAQQDESASRQGSSEAQTGVQQDESASRQGSSEAQTGVQQDEPASREAQQDEPPTRKQLRLEHDDTIQKAVQAAFKDK